MSSTHHGSLQQAAGATGFNAHLVFFDRDDDQRISLRETQFGLARIGMGHLIAWPATAVIHLGVAGLGVVRGSLQNPLQLSLPGLGMLRHPDTALVDAGAAFDPAQCDEVFTKYGSTHGGDALTLTEILKMARERLLQETHGIADLMLLPGGAAGTFVEWAALLWLAGEQRDGQRVLTKHAAMRFYTDPGFFADVAARRERVRIQRAKSASGTVRNLVQSWLF